MITTRQFSTSNHKNYNWYFVPSMFSGTVRIIVGLLIGYVLGWV